MNMSAGEAMSRSTAKRWSEQAACMLLVCAALQAEAQTRSPSKPPTPPASEWARGNRVLLGVTQPAFGLSAQWRFERSTTDDILLERQENRAGRIEAGSFLLIDGALIVRDTRLEPGKELDAVNGPLLMLQLVLQLLERSVPAGPSQLTRELRVDLAEHKRAIAVTGIGADGEFAAPWRLTGSVGPAGKGIVKFELEFSSAARGPAGARYQTSIAGIWQNTPPAVVFQDSMSLRGWQVYRFKPVVRQRGAVNAMGLGTSAPLGFLNLGEVRRHTLLWADEQAKRSRWQCS